MAISPQEAVDAARNHLKKTTSSCQTCGEPLKVLFGRGLGGEGTFTVSCRKCREKAPDVALRDVRLPNSPKWTLAQWHRLRMAVLAKEIPRCPIDGAVIVVTHSPVVGITQPMILTCELCGNQDQFES